MGVHDGHRNRMKSRFKEAEANAFDDHNLLELLLFYAVPRRDTNELAHALINRFGSYSAVLEASIDELMTVDGIGESTAVLIKLVPEMNKRYMHRANADVMTIDSSSVAGEYFLAKFAYETIEVAYAMYLDSKNRIISCREISRGVVNGTNISVRAIAEQALACKASSVIIAHNHPDGSPVPSAEDELTTQKIKVALSTVGIRLADHIVVGGEHYVSFVDYGLMRV